MILQVAELLGVRTHCVELGKLLIHAGQLLEEPGTMLGQGLAEFLTKLLDEKHGDLARIGFIALGERELVKLLDRAHETPRQRLRTRVAGPNPKPANATATARTPPPVTVLGSWT